MQSMRHDKMLGVSSQSAIGGARDCTQTRAHTHLVKLKESGLQDAMLAKMSVCPRQNRIPHLLLQLINLVLEFNGRKLLESREGAA